MLTRANHQFFGLSKLYKYVFCCVFMDGAVKVLLFTLGAIFIILLFVLVWKDDSGQSLIDRFGQYGSGAGGAGQQTDGGSGDGSTGYGSGINQPEQEDILTGQVIATEGGGFPIYISDGSTLSDIGDITIGNYAFRYSWSGTILNSVILDVTVQNMGATSTIPTVLRADLSGMDVQDVNVPAIAPSSAVTVSVSYANPSQGSHTLFLSADFGNAFSESDEDNNVLSVGEVLI